VSLDITGSDLLVGGKEDRYDGWIIWKRSRSQMGLRMFPNIRREGGHVR
jgi:hypothetical protein